jgi:diguanylate cyclase
MHRFLSDLTARLDAFDGFLDTTEASRAQAIDASRSLHASVSAQVGEIRDVTRDATELEQLRRFVEGRVETVQCQVAEFLREAETRGQRAEDEISRLGRELEATRGEATELRSRLDEARVRAMRDGLTGAYNRAALEDRLDGEEARWRRYGQPLAMLLWDIDHFKSINDRYGHLAGDKVLKAVVSLLDRNTRESDFVARYGGEEFIVLLPSTHEEDAYTLAEKLRVAVAGAGFKYRGDAVRVTASCGVTALREGDTAREALRRADLALYAAKKAGRDRVVRAE